MPHLGDYLGLLASEITIARMQADLEAVRVAELYSSHPLLRHMTVPRFTLPKVELDVPVVVRSMEEPRPGESARGGVDPDKLRAAFDGLMNRTLRRERIPLSREDRVKLKRSLDHTVGRFARPDEVRVDVGRLAREMTKDLGRVLQDPGRAEDEVDPERIAKLTEELEDLATVEFLKNRTAPPRLDVLVTTQEVRDAGTEAITHLRLTINEHAVEWTKMDSNGDHDDRLVPE